MYVIQNRKKKQKKEQQRDQKMTIRWCEFTEMLRAY